jgi:spermidine/putrescine transport system substrate-binding protein
MTKGKLLIAALATLVAALVLAACGGGDDEIGGGSESEATTVDASGKPSGELVISNWPLYIDKQTVPDFEKASGVSVKYIEDVNDNAEFFGKMQPQLDQGESGGRSIFVVTDWMAKKMYDLGYLQNLDKAAIPNVEKNLLPSLQHPSFDENRDFAIPWQGGMTGVIVRTDLAPDVRSICDLFDPKYKGKVEMLTEMRDTVPLVMKCNGVDLSQATEQDWLDAIDKIGQAADDGQIRRFTGNDYVDDMKSGDIVACEAWSGDVINLLGGGKYKFVQPEEGFAIWTDNMLVPNKAEHKTNVETMMNFYYDPVNAAKLSAWNYYFCPVAGAQEEIGQFDKSAVESEFIFVDDATLDTGYMFMSLSDTEERDYQRQFNEVIGG